MPADGLDAPGVDRDPGGAQIIAVANVAIDDETRKAASGRGINHIAAPDRAVRVGPPIDHDDITGVDQVYCPVRGRVCFLDSANCDRLPSETSTADVLHLRVDDTLMALLITDHGNRDLLPVLELRTR